MRNSGILLVSGLLLCTGTTFADSHSGTLPVLHINTENNQEITTKEYYINATYWLESNDPNIESIGTADSPVDTEIKARGNYTWSGFDKKPYKLKLAKKTKFMGMDKNKHFALLAHADDNMGFMRNITGFELSRRLGLAWTPMDSPVEYYLNGDYKGLYFVTQTIRIDETRVNITEQDDLATEGVDGGWLVEIDNYNTDPHIDVTEHSGHPIYFTYKSPEELSAAQEDYLTAQLNGMNDAIYADDKNSSEWLDYIDLESAARFYIVQEILDDCESYHGSCYIYKDRGEGAKWHFGPVWDFGNAYQRGDKSQFIWQDAMFHQTWIGEICKYPVFQQKVREVWAEFCADGYAGLEKYLTDYAEKIAEAAHSNYARWEQYGNDDVKAKAEQMVRFLRGSVRWLGEQWGAIPPELEQYESLYVRGDFNSWDISHEMTHTGNGTYELLFDGIDFTGTFKIATSDWNTIDLGAPEADMTPELEKTFELVKGGPNINAPVLPDGYRMIVNVNDRTMLFTNGSGVATLPVEDEVTPVIYTITGQRVECIDGKGIYLLRYPDRTIKVIR